MEIPVVLTKAEQEVRARLAAEALDAATYEKSLVAFVMANKPKAIAIAVLVSVVIGPVGFVLGKLL